MHLPAQTLVLFKPYRSASCGNIISITEENPGSFSFAGSLHGCLDFAMKPPCRIPEFLELLQDIRRTKPILVAENNEAIQGFAAGTKFKDVNLGLQLHPVPKCQYHLGSFWQRMHLPFQKKNYVHKHLEGHCRATPVRCP